MKFTPMKCPTCGEPAVMITESVLRFLSISTEAEDAEPGEYDYTHNEDGGSDEVCWESSEPVTSDSDRNPGGKTCLVQCENLHDWEPTWDKD